MFVWYKKNSFFFFQIFSFLALLAFRLFSFFGCFLLFFLLQELVYSFPDLQNELFLSQNFHTDLTCSLFRFTPCWSL